MNRRKIKTLVTHGRPAGFTLIEVLLVVLIIGILAAVVVPRFSGRGKQAKETAARGSMAGIKTAIAMYETDNGNLPPSLQALLVKGSEANWRGPYVDARDIKDPWGRDFIYIVKGETFELKCLGQDGAEGGDDDILP